MCITNWGNLVIGFTIFSYSLDEIDDEEIDSDGEFDQAFDDYLRSSSEASGVDLDQPAKANKATASPNNNGTSASTTNIGNRSRMNMFMNPTATNLHSNRIDNNGSGSSINLLPILTPSLLLNLQQTSPLRNGASGSRIHLRNLLSSSQSVYGIAVDVDNVDCSGMHIFSFMHFINLYIKHAKA